MAKYLIRYFIIVQYFQIINSLLFPLINPNRLYNYIPPENEVVFHLYHRNDLLQEYIIQIGNDTSLEHSPFDQKLSTIIIIHGWTHGRDTPWVREMAEVLVDGGFWNVFVVDWSKLSRVPYIEARVHNFVVGKQVKNLLIFLAQTIYYPLSSIHIVGHSMGAQIGATAAHFVQLELGQKVARLTGLDPAAPLYEIPHIESLDEVIDPSDATFVDVIHTNAKQFGMITPTGHVDYYPNGGQRQWGCTFWSCSHIRSCEYFIASIRKPNLFKAISYKSWEKFINKSINYLDTYPMGIASSPKIPNGIYYLKIEDQYKEYSFSKTTILLIANTAKAKDRKVILAEDKFNATNFMTIWEFDGVLKYTPLFYGWYANTSSGGYKVPLAYFMTGLVVYGYSFFATLRKMAENSRTSKLSEKDDECIFTWKVFTAWDYMIGNAETAHNRVASIIMGFKEALLEEAEKKKDARNWKVTYIRVLVNLTVIALLALSMYVVVLVVKRSTEPEAERTFWRKNEISISMNLITFVFPMIFEVLGLFEQYHPRKQLRLQLGRIMVLNLVNLYSLIFALIDKIGDMTTELQSFKNITRMLNESFSMTTATSPVDFISTDCACFSKKEALFSRDQIIDSDLSGLVSNITTLMISNITTTFTESVADFNFLNTSLTNFVTNIIQEKIENLNITLLQNLNYTDIEYKFADYLTYILFSMQDYIGNTTENGTSVNDNLTTTTWTWTEFSSTILPLLNNTDSTSDIGRFDYDFSSSTIFDYTSTTLEKETTTEIPYCKEFCKQLNKPVEENIEQAMNYTMKTRFRNLCWETMFGQELISITFMDLIMTIVPSLGMDFFRGIFVRVMNRCWCWDLEKKFPKYGDFKVAENILSLVNNQGIVWMGMFFCPGLVVLNVIKLYITMYFKVWAVMTCNVPPEIIFRASRSNNFYYYLLLMMLFLCVLPVGYTIVWIKPSWHCGPFSKYQRIFHIFTKTIKDNVPDVLQKALDYIASPGIVIPLLVLLILIIYYLLSLTNSLREANEDLKVQLRRERTEERRKMFQLADRRRRGGSGESNELSNTPFNKWKKLMGNLPSGKSLDETPKQECEDIQLKDERIENRGKDFFSKFIKRALGKASTSEDDQNVEDGTDSEQHDSLPYDTLNAKSMNREMRPSFSWAAADFQNAARKALHLKKTKTEVDVPTETKHVQINDIAIVNSDVNKNITMIRQAFAPKSVLNRQNSDSNNKNPNIDNVIIRNVPSTSKDIIRESFAGSHKTNSKIETANTNIDNVNMKNVPSTSKEVINETSDVTIKEDKNKRQDSESSIWSDGIPVITISKTESSENICDEVFTKEEEEDVDTFKPKIKCVLMKQATVDEDTIRYFNNDIEKNISMINAIKAVTDEDLNVSENLLLDVNDSKSVDESLTDKSSSDDTEQKESSTYTVLRLPKDD